MLVISKPDIMPTPRGSGTILGPWVFSKSGWVGLPPPLEISTLLEQLGACPTPGPPTAHRPLLLTYRPGGMSPCASARPHPAEPMPPKGLNWDDRYNTDEFIYGTAPNDFLAEWVGLLPPSGRVLCLAEGEGRNAVFLAERGHNVTGMDMSEVGLAKARKLAEARGVAIETVVADLNAYEFAEGNWDAIIGIFCHVPPPTRAKMLAAVPKALRPGGIFLLEAYTPAQLAHGTGGPPVPEMMYSKAVLESELGPGLSVEWCKELVRPVVEGTFHTGEGAVVQYIGRKNC